MNTKAANKSVIAAAVAASKGGKTQVLERKAGGAFVNVSPKGDAALPNDAHKADRLKALQAIDTAEDLFGSALVNGLIMTAQFGQTSKAEVSEGYTRCKSPDVYASWFNRGAKVAAIIGIDATVELIDKCDKLRNADDRGGSANFVKARDALGAVIQQAKTAGAKELAPKAAKAAVTFALKSASDKSATRKKSAPVVRARSTVNLAAAALEAGKGHKELAAFVKLASQTAHRLPEREGKESLHREALAALANASELWQKLAK